MTSLPWVLFLSGPSSAGKTSLARELLPMVGKPSVLLEADKAYPTCTPWPEDLEPAILTFHRSAAVWLSVGVNVILDGSFPNNSPALRAACLAEFPADRRWILGVSCSIDELRRREVARPESRVPGWAEQQADTVNDGLDLIATIDTTDGRTDDHARQALRALDRVRRSPPHAPLQCERGSTRDPRQL